MEKHIQPEDIQKVNRTISTPALETSTENKIMWEFPHKMSSALWWLLQHISLKLV